MTGKLITKKTIADLHGHYRFVIFDTTSLVVEAKEISEPEAIGQPKIG